jgi:hypothetical protein
MKKFHKATIGLDNSRSAVEDLKSTADGNLIRKWTQEEQRAQKNRELDETVMDIYDAKISKGKY